MFCVHADIIGSNSKSSNISINLLLCLLTLEKELVSRKKYFKGCKHEDILAVLPVLDPQHPLGRSQH